MDHSQYCREIETYLCRKNNGHLVRIVGPVFEQVCGWADRGVPLKIAFRGIDRYCERHQVKGPRRRPVRLEFCEADILDLFDDWRRAMGVPGGAAEHTEEERTARKPALAGHVDRAIARLLAVRPAATWTEQFGGRLDHLVQELDDLARRARHARGDARSRIIERLAALDVELLSLAVDQIDTERSVALRKEAEEELAVFGTRMSSEAREHASGAAFGRLVREALGLPVLRYE
jgi:hypothetical protein